MVRKDKARDCGKEKMCGIFGALDSNIGDKQVEICLKAIQHRGPDGEGLYRDSRIILGHRRLSILDLSDHAKQPMSYADGRYIIVYNGEIYNFLELKQELQEKGYAFKSDSDTEIVVAAYMEWKENCLDRFNGMWAFAIWDNISNELFLSRDRFGIKPLFYVQEGDAFLFASEMKALLPVMKSREINYKVLQDADVFKFETSNETLICGINRMPAGTYAYVREGCLTVKRWWNTLDHIPDIPENYNEQAETLREVFYDACKIRMRSDVKIGTALSGGLDSSATICTMADIARNSSMRRVCKDWQHAFVACFPETPLDEREYAEKVTDFLQIPNVYLNIEAQEYVDEFEDMLYMFEELYWTTPVPMMALYREVKKNGVSVTLDGHGADELFAGYSFNVMDALPSAHFSKKRIDEILDVLSNQYPHDGSNISIKDISHNYRLCGDHLIRYYIKKIRQLKEYGNPDKDHPQFIKMESLNKTLYYETHYNILPTLLRNYDRYSMASGVEIRMPFMDHRVVSMAFAIPTASKIRNGYTKAIVRDALGRYMPKEIVERKLKIGFNTPIIEWMQGGFKEYFEDIVSSADFMNSSTINPKYVKKLILELINSGERATFAQGQDAYNAIAPYLWERCFYRKALGQGC